MDNLKIVKIIVCALTFLLVLGTLTLLGTIYKKTRAPLPAHEINYNLAQPAGSQISQYSINDGRLYLLVKNGGLSDRIIIYNPEQASVTGTIQLN